MRADARRNYEQLIGQAKIAFAESGVNASLDEIARRAGVASGTLYRHFPTRMDLVEAVLADQIADLVDLGRRLLTGGDAFDALATWLRAALTHGLTYRGLSAAVMNSALDRDTSMVSAWHTQMFDAGTALLTRARQAHTITTDANDADVLKMVGAIAWAAQDFPDRAAQAERMLTLLLNGHARRTPGDHRAGDPRPSATVAGEKIFGRVVVWAGWPFDALARRHPDSEGDRDAVHGDRQG